jgi:hypothetical protein
MTEPTVLSTRNTDNRSHIDRINPEGDTMTYEQGEEIKAMLRELIEMSRPGAELCQMHIAAAKAQQEAAAQEPAPVVETPDENPPTE